MLKSMMIKDEDSLCRRAQLANHQMNGQIDPVLTNEVEFSGKLQSLWPTSVPKFLDSNQFLFNL